MKLRRTPIVLAALATLALTSFSSISLANSSCPAGVSWGCEMGGYAPSWDTFRGKAFATQDPSNEPLNYEVKAFFRPHIKDTAAQIGYSLTSQQEEADLATNGYITTSYGGVDLTSKFTGKDDGDIFNLDELTGGKFPSDLPGITTPDQRYISIGGWSYSVALHELFLEAYLAKKAQPGATISAVSQNMLKTPVIQNFLTSIKTQLTSEQANGIDFDFENPGFLHTHTLMGLTKDFTDDGPGGQFSPQVENIKTIKDYLDPSTEAQVEGLLEIQFYIDLIKEAQTDNPKAKISIALPIDFHAENGYCQVPQGTASYNGDPAAAINNDMNSMWCNMRNMKSDDGQQSLWGQLFDTIRTSGGNINLMDFDMHAQFDQSPDGNTDVPARLHTDTNVTTDMLSFLQTQACANKENCAANMKTIKLGIAPYGHEEIIKKANDTQAKNWGYNTPLVTVPTNKGKDNLSTDSKTEYSAGTSAALNVPYLDPANSDPFPTLGGFVDATGVYPYACIVTGKSTNDPGTKTTTAGATTGNSKPAGECPLEDIYEIDQGKPTFTGGQSANQSADSSGQAWPFAGSKPYNVTTTFENNKYNTTMVQDSDDTLPNNNEILGSWITSETIPNTTTGSMFNYTQASPVAPDADVAFTYDSQQAVKSKVDYLVKRFGLGGVWLWDYGEDAHNADSVDPTTADYEDKSLHKAAYDELHSSTPGPDNSTKITIISQKAGSGTETIVWQATASTKDTVDYVDQGADALKAMPDNASNPTIKTTKASKALKSKEGDEGVTANFTTVVSNLDATHTGVYKLNLETNTKDQNGYNYPTDLQTQFTTSGRKPETGKWTSTLSPSSGFSGASLSIFQVTLQYGTDGFASDGAPTKGPINVTMTGLTSNAITLTCDGRVPDKCNAASAITLPTVDKATPEAITFSTTDQDSDGTAYDLTSANNTFTVSPTSSTDESFSIHYNTSPTAIVSGKRDAGFAGTGQKSSTVQMQPLAIISINSDNHDMCFASNNHVVMQIPQDAPATLDIAVKKCKQTD